MENGLAGFIVAAYDEHTLERQDLDYFITGSSANNSANAPDRVAAMAAFLKRWGDTGSLLAVTSIKTPGPDPAVLADPLLQAGVWSGLAQEIAAIGGTYHGFNTAASTGNSDYTLIGFTAAAEGAGAEAFGDKARLQGVLVQDHESRYRPANVVAYPPAGSAASSADADAPSELLTGVVITAPGTKPWPLAGDAGAQSAFSYIGAQYPQLTRDPRTAYWSNGLDAEDAAKRGARGPGRNSGLPVAAHLLHSHPSGTDAATVIAAEGSLQRRRLRQRPASARRRAEPGVQRAVLPRQAGGAVRSGGRCGVGGRQEPGRQAEYDPRQVP